MGLRLKFNLVLLLTSAIGLALAAWFSHTMLQKNAREEVLQMARIMMESAIAVRSYTVDEIKPLLEVQQRRAFIPQTVPAYAASRYVNNLQQKHPHYGYKEATLNPTNPANRATEWEADIVAYFRSRSAETEIMGERDTPTGRYLYMGQPIKITNPACLACHDTPANAPETLLMSYGEANGFGWKMNEVVGAQIVTVPMSLPLERAQQAFMTFMGALVGVFVLIIVILNILLHVIVIKPVRVMSRTADQISMGDLNVEELTIKGSDEIASLGRSFNRMHRSLSNAVKMLDETLDDD